MRGIAMARWLQHRRNSRSPRHRRRTVLERVAEGHPRVLIREVEPGRVGRARPVALVARAWFDRAGIVRPRDEDASERRWDTCNFDLRSREPRAPKDRGDI